MEFVNGGGFAGPFNFTEAFNILTILLSHFETPEQMNAFRNVSKMQVW
jgi:hypothetical protein